MIRRSWNDFRPRGVENSISHYIHYKLIGYNGIHMPAASPPVGPKQRKILRDIGQRLRNRRKRLAISATTAAEAAEMSRLTLARIERGEPSVTIGAYVSVIYALGLEVEVVDPKNRKRELGSSIRKLPPTILPSDYPQLKRLGWQLESGEKISLKDAIDIYERNWRHIDVNAMDLKEREFLEALLATFGRERLLV